MKSSIAAASALLSVVLVSGQALATEIQYKIIGGAETSIEDYPSLAAILYTQSSDRYDQFDRQFCGGNFITTQWVLTAAHCMFDSSFNQASASDISILANVTDLTVGGTELSVAGIEVHPDYSPSVVDTIADLALIYLEEPAAVTPMSLYSGSVAAGTSAWLAGWGALNYTISGGASNYAEVLNDVELPIVSNSDCNSVYEQSGTTIYDSQMCAGLDEGGKDSCSGDSGGPLMIASDGALVQAGIVSFGAGCALAGYPGVYTRVGSYTDWIQSKIETGVSVSGSTSASKSSGGGLGALFVLPFLAVGARLLRRNR
jgi:secreted trypsin-like serine protease